MATTTQDDSTRTIKRQAADSPTPTVDPGDGTNLRNSSSLLFGFLVTFLALFVVFMLFGLCWRHYTDRQRTNRRRVIEEGQQKVWRKKIPKLWDVWIMPSSSQWKEIKPLSISVAEPASPITTATTSVIQQHSLPGAMSETMFSNMARSLRSPRAHLASFFRSAAEMTSSFTRSLFRRNRRRASRGGNGITDGDGEENEMTAEKERELEKMKLLVERVNKSGLKVAVIIAMPTPHPRNANLPHQIPSLLHPHSHSHERSESQGSSASGSGSGSGSGSRSSFDSRPPTDRSADTSAPVSTTGIRSSLAKVPEITEVIESSTNHPPLQAGLHEYALGLTQVTVNPYPNPNPNSNSNRPL